MSVNLQDKKKNIARWQNLLTFIIYVCLRKWVREGKRPLDCAFAKDIQQRISMKW